MSTESEKGFTKKSCPDMIYFRVFDTVKSVLKKHLVLLLLFFAVYASEFRKGVWGITLFSPEKGFPQKDCPDIIDFLVFDILVLENT